MTKDDIKHALISLILGILVTASMQLLNGLAHIFQAWASGVSGGITASATYLHLKNLV